MHYLYPSKNNQFSDILIHTHTYTHRLGRRTKSISLKKCLVARVLFVLFSFVSLFLQMVTGFC